MSGTCGLHVPFSRSSLESFSSNIVIPRLEIVTVWNFFKGNISNRFLWKQLHGCHLNSVFTTPLITKTILQLQIYSQVLWLICVNAGLKLQHYMEPYLYNESDLIARNKTTFVQTYVLFFLFYIMREQLLRRYKCGLGGPLVFVLFLPPILQILTACEGVNNIFQEWNAFKGHKGNLM